MFKQLVNMSKGWHREPYRHSLASKGIQTNKNVITPIHKLNQPIASRFDDITDNPYIDGWILSDGRKYDTGPHHMSVSSALPKSQELQQMIDDPSIPNDELNEIWEVEWEQISGWQHNSGSIVYEFENIGYKNIPEYKMRIITGEKRPTNEQIALIASYIREAQPSYIHIIRADKGMFNGEPEMYTGEYEKTNPKPIDLQIAISKLW